MVDLDHPLGQINPCIYGQFAEHLGTCIYDGFWVGLDSPVPNLNGIRADVVEALKKLRIPVLRWPGGCFADDYHWQDGIGPRETRPCRLNIHWDAEESNEFGTHEFFELCRQLDCEPYICGNLGSGTVREMRDWLEYMNSERDTTLTRLRAENGSSDPLGVRYFGIGNENWGCGGNFSPEFYAEEYRRYASFANLAGGNFLFKIACGANADDYDWTQRFFATMVGRTDERNRCHLATGYALHYYAGTAGNSFEYTEDQWYQLLAQALRIEPILLRHRQIMDQFDPQKKVWVIVDEWGTQHPPLPGTNPHWSKSQNTIRDALVAALTLDIFNRHAKIVYMANIAQVVNNGHAMVFTEGEQFVLTPTYHVYEMYTPHQGAQSLKMQVSTGSIPYSPPLGSTPLPPVPHIAGSCSRRGTVVTLSIVNAHISEYADVTVDWRGNGNPSLRSWRVLTAPDIHAHNSFEEPEVVIPREVDCESIGATLSVPPASVNVMQYEI
ncbi:MAG TPA: alpha-L-arabinofuranosidase C-terminal domain-containing protein [Candidatus Lokiarchaeia archaeon]|nr:alpha-L-arabinofuranosidase C-terminal domain-containing protein [Candidatus Lokiarchaeia archaeon]